MLYRSTKFPMKKHSCNQVHQSVVWEPTYSVVCVYQFKERIKICKLQSLLQRKNKVDRKEKKNNFPQILSLPHQARWGLRLSCSMTLKQEIQWGKRSLAQKMWTIPTPVFITEERQCLRQLSVTVPGHQSQTGEVLSWLAGRGVTAIHWRGTG